ncbi:MAG: sterol desaturase family protein [Hyalangium sp.]|uniref:sterol desaturase family protein n=1 Tax=Hyalangium sp. TaxID=2028555 RepID=UPI00389A92CC
MTQLDTNGYYALGIPVCVLAVALELYFTRAKGLRAYGFANSLGNLSGGLGEVVIGFFLGPLLFALYEFGYEKLALIHWPKDSLIPWILAFFAADFCYYWYHRAGHTVAVFWAIHGVHHQAEEFNVTIAMRHPWFSDFYSALFYIPLPMLGITAPQFFVAISVISFYSLSVHSRIFNRPSLYAFVTPAIHICHHSRNRRYLGKNLGALFTLWDRMFGTYVEVDPADPPLLGTPRGYETHDGAKAQWIFFRDIASAFKLAKTWPEKLKAVFGRPGWTPPGTRLERQPPARSDAALSTGLKAYAAIQFFVMCALAIFIFHRGELMSPWPKALISGQVLLSLTTLGGLLDGRKNAVRWEALRVLLLIASLWGLSARFGAQGLGLG